MEENNEEVLPLLEEFLKCAYEVYEELEIEMARIENPNIHTDSSKRKVRAKMRLINNVIYSGEKARESLLADQAKVLGKKKR